MFRDDLARKSGRLLLLLACGAMVCRDVRHFVRKHSGHFRSVIGQGEKAARDVEISPGKGKRIDGRRIEDRDLVGLRRIL